jgi:hypothetical protein
MEKHGHAIVSGDLARYSELRKIMIAGSGTALLPRCNHFADIYIAQVK